MSKNKHAFIAILPLLTVMAIAPHDLEKLNRGIASEVPVAEAQVKPEDQKVEPKKEEEKKVEVKEEVKAQVAEEKKEEKKDEPKPEKKKEEAKVAVESSVKEDKKEEKKEDPKKVVESLKEEKQCENEEHKTINNEVKDLVSSQQSLMSQLTQMQLQMTQMQQQMVQQKNELEWKMLFASLNMANNNSQMMNSPYFSPYPYGPSSAYGLSQMLPMTNYNSFSNYSPTGYQDNAYMSPYPTGMGIMGQGYPGSITPQYPSPYQPSQYPASSPSTLLPQGVGFNMQVTPAMDPRLAPMALQPGQFGGDAYSFGFSQSTPIPAPQGQPQITVVPQSQTPVLPSQTGGTSYKFML